IIQTTTTCDRRVFLYNNYYYLSNTSIEMNQNHPWNKANKKAHEIVNQMINEKQQGIIVISTNIDQFAKSNNKKFWQEVPFSMMINSKEYLKQKIIIGKYSICLFCSKKITFDDITIDGCVYVVDCVIRGIGNCYITQQLIHTNKSVIQCSFHSPVFTCSWPINTKQLMRSGKKLLKNSNLNEAIQFFHFLLCVRLQTLHHSHIDVAKSYFYLGIAYYNKREHDKAVEYHERSLNIRLDKFGHDHIDVATSYNYLGVVYYNKEEYNKAIEYYERSLKIRLDKLGHDHINVADSYSNLGSVYYGKGEYNKAIEYYEKSLKIGLDKLGHDHIDVATSYHHFGSAYKKKGEYDKAIEYYEKSLKIRSDKLGHDHIRVAHSYNNLGI
ncbi:hypothetical protein RFI_39725, partial [Reticulomyxa filosa]